MGAEKPTSNVTCHACGRQYATRIRQANAKCTCGATTYIRKNGTWVDKGTGQASTPPDPPDEGGTATGDNGDHDDDTGGATPPPPTTSEVPRYAYQEPVVPNGKGRPNRKKGGAPADVPPPPGGDPAAGGAGAGGGAPDGGPPPRQPSRVGRAVAAVRRRRVGGPHPYPYGRLFGQPDE